MGMRPVPFTVAIGALAAAVGVGAYLAVRQNETPVASTAVAAAVVPAAPAVETTAQVVETTEQVVETTEPVAPSPAA
ncbi:MAG: 2-oxoglutarate dehydrogenase, E2 component, dihydrolipoamide succinyltransferase, partial [Acidobacteria bacterium]|nr:2-oxoglutarate dehydrogenase, E2 component, dihydrolipoamide succinyltransferase [Acidobacteriota bacterium]